MRKTERDENSTYSRKTSQFRQLRRSFLLSIAGIIVSCACLTGVTFAWFTTAEITKTNSVDAGVIAIDLFKSNAAVEDPAKAEFTDRDEINKENPVVTSEDMVDFGPGKEIIKRIVVSNHGTLYAEYNIGIKAEVVDEEGEPITTTDEEGNVIPDASKPNIAEIIDVFIEKYEEPDEEEPAPTGEPTHEYIYLGTLAEMNSKKNYEEDERIYVKGLLYPQYYDIIKSTGEFPTEESEETTEPAGEEPEEETTPEDTSHFEDMYYLRFKMKSKAEAKYQNCNLKITVELVSNKKVDDICTIKALTNNEEYGLVFGGGTYYVDGPNEEEEYEGHKIELIPRPNEGYKFQKWEEDGSSENPRVIVTDRDQKWTAIFVKASEFEEEEYDPFAEEEEETEDDFEEGGDIPLDW